MKRCCRKRVTLVMAKSVHGKRGSMFWDVPRILHDLLGSRRKTMASLEVAKLENTVDEMCGVQRLKDRLFCR